MSAPLANEEVPSIGSIIQYFFSRNVVFLKLFSSLIIGILGKDPLLMSTREELRVDTARD